MKASECSQFKLNNLNIKIIAIAIISLSFLFSFNSSALAENNANNNSSIYLDKATIAKGYTVTGFNENLKLSLVPGILNEDTRVDMEEIVGMSLPFNLEKLSPVYQFEFRNKAAYDNHKPFYIQFSYDEENSDYKQVFFFDNNYNTWRPLPTRDYPEENFVRSLIHLPYARIAVFSYPNVMGQGDASWYAYKGGNFAASPDFPKGSIIRVHNLANDKYVDVEINDFGPDRSIFPNRIIDLDKEAFRKISSPSAGIIQVKIEPLKIIKDKSQRTLGLTDKGAHLEPEISAQAAVIIDEESGEVLWEKNGEEILPIASLTKVMAVKIFLDNNRDLKQIVEYKYQDEEYNYQYCEKWESSRIRLDEGDRLTVNDLIYSSLVGSANNAVETLVRYSGLSRDAFIKAMNDKARILGANSTHFDEPTGLSTKNVSSALDYAIIAKEVLKDPVIASAVSARHYSFSTIDGTKVKNLYNTNSWLRYSVMPFTASKTGYLHEAKYCLMSRIQSADGRQLISIVLGAESRDESLFSTKDAFNYSSKIFLH
ncbi:MAG: RlpA-like double-psi beta-barrel domain-containing protein [Parcubacteria group bacterium]